MRAVPIFTLLVMLTACASEDREEIAETELTVTESSLAKPAEPTFGGLWQTTYGTLRLEVQDERTTGTYTYGEGATVEGKIEGDRLAFTYREHDGTVGRALFELSADGERFDGVWRPGADGPALDLNDRSLERWTGERVHATPGRTWLVILEMPWEESLREHEFSYGAMLRSFFERLPDVAVRHRFVHDRADLLRFLGELHELPDPVIVYISSHGTPEGVQAADGTIDGATIGRCLRGAGNIELLHFGACSALRGDLGNEILAAATPHARFPISGYRRDADWAGSAIVDFTYLDLILERGMSPKDAVDEVRRSLEFATHVDRKDAAIPAIDLVIQ